ncbi:Galactoside 2-alpha-L-fucosyltransferase 2 [Dirofilaria immitis]|nr:Galactoside 2-alpha-L-fucosyltransferase 2 [Dirofilaria immitis]
MQGCFVIKSGLVVLTFATTSFFLVLLITNWSFYGKHVTDSNHLGRLSVIQVARIFPQGGEDVEFNQPWTLTNIEIVENIEDIDQNKRYLISNFSWSPGLGNLMFQYASLRAIAERYNAKLIIPVKCKLRRGFRLDAIIVSNELNDKLIRRYSRNERHFDEDLIRKQFNFLPEIRKRANEYLRQAKNGKLHAEATAISDFNHHNQVDITSFYDYVYVGIHIRRGIDVTMNSRNIKYGHTAITKDYVISAMNYFRSRFKNLLFVISTDNEHWVEANVNHIRKGEIYIISSGYREVDMATLIHCNHTIMSTGTFSWWIAYLTNGTAVYYNDWPRHGSALEKMMNKDEYFLNSWIPME